MHVERARADRVAPGQRDLGPTEASDQRAQHGDRAADAPHQFVRSLGRRLGRNVDRDLVGAVLVASVTPHPNRSMRVRMIATSEMAGRLLIVVGPSASNVAAMSFRTLFLAP